jgi:hypothetical protein
MDRLSHHAPLTIARNRRCVELGCLLALSMVALAIALLMAIPSGAQGERRSMLRPPSYAIEAGHHRQPDGDSWALWLYGNREGRQCWFTQVVQQRLPHRYETCGVTVPRDPWQLASQGPVGRAGDRETVLFFLARPDLAALKVLVRRPAGGPLRRLTISVHRLSASRAHRARLRRPIGYAVGRVRGEIGEVGKVEVVK